MSIPVRVALDVHALQVPGYADRGIGRYVANHAAYLAQTGRVAAALLAPELPPPSGLPGDLVTRDLIRWDSLTETRHLLAGGGRVAYHVTAPFLHSGPGEPPCLGVSPHWARLGVPRIVTLYDLIPLRAPTHYLPTLAHEDRYRERAKWVAEADLVLTISDYTRGEAIDLLGVPADRVVTIGSGVSEYFCPPDGTDDELWAHHFASLTGRPFLVTVGGSDARKGTDQAIAALGTLTDRDWDLHLMVVGDLTPAWRAELAELAAATGVADRVIFTGSINDELLRACYRRAEATVVPSLAEGAGLPILESAASGTPALASCTTALGEMAASPYARFDPNDSEAIAACIAALLSDQTRREEVLAAQQRLAAVSTWEAVAARTVAALDALAGVLPAGAWTPRHLNRHIGLVGPLPPAGGGIGAYNARLIVALPADAGADFEVVTDDPPPPDLAHLPTVSTASLGVDTRAASYDGVVYSIGNSSGHLPAIEAALKYPGWLWLHEARLPAVATTALEGLGDEEFDRAMAWLLSRAYPGRPPLDAARKAGRSHLDLVSAGVGLIGPLAERCRGILVNSEIARRLVLLDLAPLASPPPLHVLPPACPPVRAGRRPPVSEDPIVAAFGILSMAKRPDVLVEAAALAGCRLAFVGPCPPILRQVIEDRARLHHISERVEVVGEVDAASWLAWMDRTALAVQLRDTISGETSAAVLEALASGLPVLTNLASAAEYPQGTVSMLTDDTAATVGQRIGELLGAPSQLNDLSEAGRDFAAAHQFDRLARELVDVVAGAPR